AARPLGAAAALLGDREGAMAYYRQALEVCERVGYRPERALTRLAIAELLLAAAADLSPDPSPARRGELDRSLPTGDPVTLADASLGSDAGAFGPRSPFPRREGGQGVRSTALAHLDFAI